MRSITRFLLISLALLIVSCTNPGGDAVDSRVEPSVAETFSGRDSELQLQFSTFDPIDHLADFIFRRELATTHVFGLTNTEGDEVYFASGRLGLPTRRITSAWSSEELGDGVWIIDADGEIYEVYDSSEAPTKLWP
jgi:hypothetical protein